MGKPCGQVNIPRVDNTLECDDFMSTDCILTKKSYKKIKVNENDSITKVLDQLVDKISTMDTQIYLLKKKIEKLELNK